MSTIIQVDDINPVIVYSGAWQAVESSTRQWGFGTVHTTTETGASATISFRGTRIMAYFSLPIGIGSEIVNMKFDGHATSVTQPSSTVQANYSLVWFDSGVVSDAVHTLVVSNGGGPSDTPLELDRFAVTGFLLPSSTPLPPGPSTPADSSSTVAPSSKVTPPGAIPTILANSPSSSISSPVSFSLSSDISASLPSTTSGSLRGETVTTTGLQYITTTAADGSVSTYISNTPVSRNSRQPATPVAAIVGGGVGGVIALILLILLFLFCLRRRRNKWRHVILDDDAEKSLISRSRTPTGITPFRLDENHASSSPPASVPRNFSHEMEIATAGLRYILASGSPAASPTATSVSRGSTEKSRSVSSSSLSNGHSSAHSAHSSRVPYTDAAANAAVGSNISTNSIITALSSMYSSTVPAQPETNTVDTPPSYQSATIATSSSQFSPPFLNQG